MKLLRFFLCLLTFFLIAESVHSQQLIRVNQIGYSNHYPKIATVANMDASSFEIRDYKSGEVVYRHDVSHGKYWNYSRETIQNLDFSDFTKEGTYYIQIDDEKSFPFVISNQTIFKDLSTSVIRAFYYWRASTAIEPPYSVCNGVDYARALGHPDTMVFIHQSAATEQRHVESIISAPKGWYDAGDYNKYVVNAGITMHQMLLSYELFPDYYKSLSLNIPESSDSIPDFYNELKWEVDWLLCMQDPYDGGVYHKLTSLRFSGFVMPSQDEEDRYVVAKSTTAALDYAAIMANFARVFKNIDTVYADLVLNAAKKAWTWAERNPEKFYNNPSDVFTGLYGDSELKDEFFWAASELFLTTNEKSYYDKLNFYQKFDTPQWRNVSSLGLISLRLHLDNLPSYVDKDLIDSKFHGLVQMIYNQFKFCSGRLALKKFEWGSNGDIAVNGNLLGLGYLIYKDKKEYVNKAQNYLQAMVANFDYLMGANPTDYCFVSGFGSKYPKNFHDRRSLSDGIEDAIPGYLCGGANPNQLTDCGRANYPSIFPARCYIDENCSWSTNEIAINWNAPLVLLVSMMENCWK